MKALRKLMSTVLAMVCGLSASVSLSASAEGLIEEMEVGNSEIVSLTTYDPCDVNQDGTVDIIDVIIVNRYLCGSIQENNYKRLDTNRSRIIDDADAEYVLSKVTEMSYSAAYIERVYNGNDLTLTESLVSFPSTDNNAVYDTNSYTSTTYSWATYTSNQALNSSTLIQRQSDYSIALPNTGINYGNNTQGVIGTDDRHLARGTRYHEITGVVSVNGATGFIVGDHEIATAAHVVVTDHSFQNAVEVHACNIFGQIDEGTYLNVTQVHVPYSYITNGYKTYTPNDYALIVVSDDLSSYVHFAIGNAYSLSATDWEDVPIYATGQVNAYSNGNKYFKQGIGRIYATPSPTSINLGNNTHPTQANLDSLLFYDTDAGSGASGGPVYTITKYDTDYESKYLYTALSVHSSYDNQHGTTPLYNYGALFNRTHEYFYLNNPKDGYNDSNTSQS